MAPRRNQNRRSSFFSMDAVNIQEQLAEMRRYEQEKKDLAYARRLEIEQNQDDAPNTPQDLPVDRPIVRNNARDELPHPPTGTSAINRRNTNDDDAAGPVQRANQARSRIEARLQFSQRVMSRTATPRVMRAVETSSDEDSDSSVDSTVRVRFNIPVHWDTSDDDPVVVPPPRRRAQVIILSGDYSSSSDSDQQSSSNTSANTLNAISENSSGSNSGNNSSSTTNRTRTVRASRRSGDSSNQPSTSRVMPRSPVRVGVPESTWGDCTMCFEVPIRPLGCNRCLQALGCETCVLSWFQSSQPAASCPLCRNKWRRKADVSSMRTIADRQRPSTTARRRTRGQ